MKLLYYTEFYEYLAKELLEKADNQLIEAKTIRDKFPDGETYLRNPHHVKGADCVILGGTIGNESIFEILNLAYQITTNGARSLKLVIPCYGYQTMERLSNPGEVVMAKSMAHWLSSIPKAAYGNEIVMLELHTDTMCHYFGPETKTTPLSATDIIMKACVELAGTSFVLGSVDVGRAKAIEYIQRAFTAKNRHYDIETAFVYKRRNSGDDTEVVGINADVKGKIVVIYDDMVRTGGSLVKAARIYRDAGAIEVYAVTTHGIFPGDAIKKIKDSGMIKQIAATNSHPSIVSQASQWPDFVRMYSTAGLFSRYI